MKFTVLSVLLASMISIGYAKDSPKDNSGYVSCADFSMKIEVHDIVPINSNAGTFQAKTELGYKILFSLNNCTLIFN